MSLFKSNATTLARTGIVYRGRKESRKPKTQTEDIIIEDIRNPFKLEKLSEVINDRIIRDIKNLFELEEDYYKLLRVGNFYRNNYIK